MPLIPALRRQRQVGLCELEASLVYSIPGQTARAARAARVVTEKSCLEKRKKRKKS